MYIMKMSLRIQERISWPGLISKWLSPYKACAQMKESVLFWGWWLVPRVAVRGCGYMALFIRVSVPMPNGLVLLTFLSETGFQPIPDVGARVHTTLQRPRSKHWFEQNLTQKKLPQEWDPQFMKDMDLL